MADPVWEYRQLAQQAHQRLLDGHPGGDPGTDHLLWFECAAQAMATLHTAGFFSRWPGAVHAFSESDNDPEERTAFRWAGMMSTPAAFEDFQAFVRAVDENERR